MNPREEVLTGEGKKRTYLKQLEKLYKYVETFLREFTESGAIRIEKKDVTIDEEYIGEYEAPGWRIYLYGKHADLLPVGANIIGTPGRVDLICNYDAIRIILADKKEKRPQVFAGISGMPEDRKRVRERAEEWIQQNRHYVWKFITEPPDIRYIELNEDSFLSALQEVLDG